MEKATGSQVQVQPFAGQSDYERMIDYFLGADQAFLRGMGIDPQRLPQRQIWLEAALLDHERADVDKERAYLAWIHQGIPVGHSSISKIRVGEDAFIHLHLWAGDLRQAGLGTLYFRTSVAEFMRAFRLKRLYCEPYAENPGPNRVLLKAGFRFIKRYRTVPGPINFEQDVNQYLLEDAADPEGRE